MTQLSQRISDWKTTGPGVAISGILVYVFNSMGCVLPSNWMMYAVVAAPTILGLLSKSK